MLSGEEAKDEDLGLARGLLIAIPGIAIIALFVFIIYSFLS